VGAKPPRERERGVLPNPVEAHHPLLVLVLVESVVHLLYDVSSWWSAVGGRWSVIGFQKYFYRRNKGGGWFSIYCPLVPLVLCHKSTELLVDSTPIAKQLFNRIVDVADEPNYYPLATAQYVIFTRDIHRT
jgi:hypothetical protein